MEEQNLSRKQLERMANEIIFGAEGRALQAKHPVLTRKRWASARRNEESLDDFFA